ncbi:TPA: NmrA/HSCARG family protein [Klebsiella pneumoniae]|nr:NmrA/HSCARG family protein [Klebsiella pneumoniae]HBR1759103.1 NmrA/HSCARG family protein [Klebsiella pneumoniae]
MTILAVGAAGTLAGEIVPALVRRGAIVRGLVHRPEQMQLAKTRGASEVAIGDLSDPTSLDAAMEGVEGVFHIGPVFAPEEVQYGKNIIQAAQRAGVRKLVFSSVIHPVLNLPNHAAKALVEEVLVNSELEYTILHPTMLYQNYAASWDRIVETGILAEPWSADTRFSRVDYRDVADVAAIALTEDRLAFGTFELCAPDILTRHGVAELLSQVLGKKVGYATLDRNKLGNVPKDMLTMFEHYDHSGLLGNPLTLRSILGREPRTLRAYFEELAQVRPGKVL